MEDTKQKREKPRNSNREYPNENKKHKNKTGANNLYYYRDSDTIADSLNIYLPKLYGNVILLNKNKLYAT